MIIIQVYFPTSNSEDDEIEQVYDPLEFRFKEEFFMSVIIEQNINKNLLKTNFALQIDKSIDISGKAQLIGIIHYYCYWFIHDNKISN